MSKTKAQELKPITEAGGDRGACPICSPRPDRIRYDRLWEYQVRTGKSPFKASSP